MLVDFVKKLDFIKSSTATGSTELSSIEYRQLNLLNRFRHFSFLGNLSVFKKVLTTMSGN